MVDANNIDRVGGLSIDYPFTLFKLNSYEVDLPVSLPVLISPLHLKGLPEHRIQDCKLFVRSPSY